MAAVTTQKCSVRRVRLRRAMQLLQEMIDINEAASQLETRMVAGSQEAADITVAMELLFASCGPPAVITTEAAMSEAGDAASASGNLSCQLFNMLNGPLVTPTNAIERVGWEYLAES